MYNYLPALTTTVKLALLALVTSSWLSCNSNVTDEDQQAGTTSAGSDVNNPSSNSATYAPVDPEDTGTAFSQTANYEGDRPQKFAMLVGINDYQWSRINDLRGCINDVDLMADLLHHKYSFPRDNLLILKNDKAARSDILNGFKQHLIDQVNYGDIAVFYYSGHGSQRADEANEETDKLDETIIPYDYKDPDGAYAISDDEINSLLGLLAEKTPNVTFILDACHSGGGTKAYSAGTSKEIPADTRTPPKPELFGSQSRDLKEQGEGFFADTYAFISGCRSDQLSYEFNAPNGNRHGRLTYYLVEELKNQQGMVTYFDVMQKVVNQVNTIQYDQSPQLEGANANSLVFGDSTLLVANHVLLRVDGEEISIDAGSIHGMSKGSKFKVFRPGARDFNDFNQAIATIELTAIEPFTSKAELLDGHVTNSARAIEVDHNFSKIKMSIFLKGNWSQPELNGLKRYIVDSGLASIVLDENLSDFILQVKEASVDFLFSTDQSSAKKSFNLKSSDLQSEILNYLKYWSRWYNVLQIVNPNSELDIDFSLEGSDNDHLFKDGENVKISIVNNSSHDLFAFLINLTDQGEINVYSIAEFNQQGGAVELLPRGETWQSEITVSTDGKSMVRDVIKIFATVEGNVSLKLLEQGNYDQTSRAALENDFVQVLQGMSKNFKPKQNTNTILGSWVTAGKVIEVRK